MLRCSNHIYDAISDKSDALCTAALLEVTEAALTQLVRDASLVFRMSRANSVFCTLQAQAGLVTQ